VQERGFLYFGLAVLRVGLLRAIASPLESVNSKELLLSTFLWLFRRELLLALVLQQRERVALKGEKEPRELGLPLVLLDLVLQVLKGLQVAGRAFAVEALKDDLVEVEEKHEL